jgi:hypothetical protein
MRISEMIRAAASEKFDPKEALKLVTQALKGISVSVTSRPDLAKKYGVQTAIQVEKDDKADKWPSRKPVRLYPTLHFFLDKMRGQTSLQAIVTEPSVSSPSKPKRAMKPSEVKSTQELQKKIKETFNAHGHDALTY